MAEKKNVVRMSVRAVVETTLHESDLSTSACAAKRMREGAAAHRARQSGAAAMDASYRAETALSADFDHDSLTLRVAGRADGIFTREDGVQVIEEIKLGSEQAELVPAHRAQAAMYGHMLCQKEQLEQAALRILYVDTQGQALAGYDETLSAAELEAVFRSLCLPAAQLAAETQARAAQRDASLCALDFPFEHYREGQRKFAANVYVAIRDKKRLFAQAPTGIGKTMAALYPALRALGEGKCARIVFLTARTTGRKSAMDAMARLQSRGAQACAVEIAAKDKLCPQETRDCRPEVCPYARGFYDRLPSALRDAAAHLLLTRDEISRLAAAHTVCPFELSLALAAQSDVVVGDYNYVFDPVVALDALLHVPGGAALLVDEAHQLSPRVQEEYSAAIHADTLRDIRREAGSSLGRKQPLYRALTGAIRTLKELAAQESFAADSMTGPPPALREAMSKVQAAAGDALAQGAGKPALNAFSLSSGYLLADSCFDEHYAVVCEGEGKRASLSLLCLNAAKVIQDKTKRARGTVFFSATLAPFDAAKRLLGSGEGDACLALASPFDPAQLDARVLPIDIRYAVREKTAPDVAAAILRHIRTHPGNTLVFFPSYAYMARIHELMLGMDDCPDIALEKERRGMTEEEKNALLGAFAADSPTALLAVLGGAFSEGVDLPGDQLKNVVIVSTGMPQPDARIARTQAYYDAQEEDGFFMTMTLPGMIRVIQAAGRLIRTDSDTGSLLLIDSRFGWPKVRALLEGTLIGDALERRARA
ncbi:MAG: ATP-dependent DNA helicase [Clostridia bacterium]|nr:ATP-dependent DNA helicase [Clostridia bacterium]